MNNNQQLGKFLQTKATKTINNLIWSQGDGICCPEVFEKKKCSEGFPEFDRKNLR